MYIWFLGVHNLKLLYFDTLKKVTIYYTKFGEYVTLNYLHLNNYILFKKHYNKLPVVLSGVVAAEVLVAGAVATAVLAEPAPPNSLTYDAGNHPICLFLPFA